MRAASTWVLLPVLLAVGGCQAIAGLDVPDYSSGAGASGSSTGGGGSSSSSASTGGGGGAGGNGGSSGCVSLPKADGKACTFDPTFTIPPCPEHLKMWFSADQACSLEKDEGGDVETWHDLSHFGWTAKSGATKAKWATFDGHPGVRLPVEGMTLVPPPRDQATLAPEGLSIFAALRWEQFGQPPQAYGTSEALCLGSTAHKDAVHFYTSNNPDPNPRFEMAIADDYTNTSLKNTSPVGLVASKWVVFSAKYGCDAACAAMPPTGDSTQELLVQDSGETSFIAHGHSTLRADLNGKGWNGFWDKSTLGTHCDHDHAPMDGEIGEILLYDTYLDPAFSDHLYAYLSNRW